MQELEALGRAVEELRVISWAAQGGGRGDPKFWRLEPPFFRYNFGSRFLIQLWLPFF